MPRNYRQFCALARALDVVGERWTLLIVRELLLGPRRYGQLLEALPGMGTNLLADRLAAMQVDGLLAHRDREYELTSRGRGLAPAILALAGWGMTPMAPPHQDERMRADWYAVAMLAAYRGEPGAPDETYEFDVDGHLFHLTVSGGAADACRGAADTPAFRLRSDLETFLAITTRAIPPARAEVSGDRRAVARWLKQFALPAPGLLQAG